MPTEKELQIAKQIRENRAEYDADPSDENADKLKDSYQKLVDEFAKDK